MPRKLILNIKPGSWPALSKFSRTLVHAYFSIPLAGLFVSLAGFNVWIMLTGRGATPKSRRIWTQIHRACGYCFIALLIIFLYFMLLRIRSTDELSPRIVLHISLAFVLVPLLLVKVLVVRYQTSAWNVLITLGVTILVIAFTLVFMNVAVHYVRNISAHKLPVAIPLSVVAVSIAAAGVGFYRKARGV